MDKVVHRDAMLVRAMRVMAAVEDGAPPTTATEISRRTGLPVATAHRIIDSMIELGMLERDHEGRFWVGTRMWELTARSSSVAALTEAAGPTIARVHATLGHHTCLSVRRQTNVLFVRIESSPTAVRRPLVTTRLPLYDCSPGIAMLAHEPVTFQEATLRAPLAVHSPGPLPQAPKELRSTLHLTRRRGYAFGPRHATHDMTTVAVPVRTAGHEVIGALSVILPRTEERLHGIGRMLMEGSAEITRAMTIAENGSAGRTAPTIRA